jgi:hypothetical protein
VAPRGAGTAGTGLLLPELNHVLGERLDPTLRSRIRYELDRRLFAPYLARHDFWWMFSREQHQINTWTAVCTSGVAGAARYLEADPAHLALAHEIPAGPPSRRPNSSSSVARSPSSEGRGSAGGGMGGRSEAGTGAAASGSSHRASAAVARSGLTRRWRRRPRNEASCRSSGRSAARSSAAALPAMGAPIGGRCPPGLAHGRSVPAPAGAMDRRRQAPSQSRPGTEQK